MTYNEKICKDYIRGYAGGGDDPAYEMPWEMYILPYVPEYAPELYSGIAGGIKGQKVRL